MDLFSGAGGLTLGLKWAGFQVVGAIEADALAAETYRANHPEVRLWAGDIRQVSVEAVAEELGLTATGLDLLAACPPCQGFSAIRTKKKGTYPDARNDLLFEVVRFVDGLRPLAVMLENVPGLSSDPRLGMLVGRLRRRGYSVAVRTLDAAQYGVPQRRRRVLLMASRDGRIAFPGASDRSVSVRDVIGALPRAGSSGDPLHDLAETRSPRVASIICGVPPSGGSRTSLPPELVLGCHGRARGFYDVYGRMDWERVAPTITGGCVNPSKGRFLHPEENRAITLREAALLQSFPKSYYFSLKHGKYAAAAMIGNAVPPLFAQSQAAAVFEHLRRRTT